MSFTIFFYLRSFKNNVQKKPEVVTCVESVMLSLINRAAGAPATGKEISQIFLDSDLKAIRVISTLAGLLRGVWGGWRGGGVELPGTMHCSVSQRGNGVRRRGWLWHEKFR